MAAQEQAWNRQQLERPVVAPQWRIWTYEQPALVLGCSQRAQYERLRAAPGGPPVEVLLRDSGGGAVLTGPWLLGMSLALPVGHPWLRLGLLESYRHVGQLYTEVLGAVGVPAHALSPALLQSTQALLAAQGLPSLDWACFGSLSPWEVVDAQGRKLVGLAQRRRQTGALLVAGVLLGAPDWPLLCEAHGRVGDAVLLRRRTVSCQDLLGAPLPPDVATDALARVLARSLR